MYVYLYDSALREKPYQSIMKAVENRLTDFGITGRIIRLTSFSSTKPIIEDEIRRGAKTFVIVGGDKTFGHVLASAAELNTVFGFLPVGLPSRIAKVLGLPMNAQACDVLSARKIESLDIGWLNNRYFISQVVIGPAEVSLEYDRRFRVQAMGGLMGVTICNLMPFERELESAAHNVHPQDRRLDAFIEPFKKKFLFGGLARQKASVFPFQEMIVRGRKPFSVVTDSKESREIRLTIRLARETLKMIVGKGRGF